MLPKLIGIQRNENQLYGLEGLYLPESYIFSAGVDNRAARHSIAGGHATRVRGRACSHAASRAAPARARRALHPVSAGHARGSASIGAGNVVLG